MAIILRTVKGSELTFAEVDGNFQSLFYSSSFDGTNLVLYTTGSTSQSIDLSTLTVDTGSLMITGSILNGTLTFTKGDSSTFNLVYNTGSFSGSFEGDGSGLTGLISSSYSQTASYVENAQTASYVENAQTASYVENAQTASYIDATNIDGIVASSSYSLTSSYVENAQTSSYISGANVDGAVNLADTASFVTTAQTASYVTTAQTASYVETSQTASYVSGLNVNGPVADAVNAVSSSYASTASYVETAQTASYVDLVAGPNVTINQVGTSFEISGSASTVDTGSLLTTASAEFAEITFTKGDGSTFLIDSTPRQVIETVKNLESGTLVKGTPVYASGSTGNAIHVYAASASLSSRMPAAYILNEDLTSGQEGEGLLLGFINGVDTSAFASGDVVYVAADGGYTNVKPTGSNLIQNLGKVTISAVNGSGVISGAGRANDVPNISEGYVWIGDSNGVATPAATSSIQNVVSSSYASTASYVETAQTASYVDASNIDGTVTSASYALTASYAQSGDGTFSGSFSGSFEGDGSGLTGVGGGTTYFTETANAIALDTGSTTRDVLEINTGTANTYGASTFTVGTLVIGDGHTIGGAGNVRRSILAGNSIQAGTTGGFQYSIAVGILTMNGSYNAGFGNTHIIDGDNNFTAVSSNNLYGNKNAALGFTLNVGTSGTNVNESVVIGKGSSAYGSNQIVIGQNIATNATYANDKAIYFGLGGSRPSAGFFQDPLQTGGMNFVVGGDQAMRSDLGVVQSGSGKGLFYMSNWSGNRVSEPTVDIADAFGIWAKDRTSGVTGMIVKAENGGKSWIGDRIGVNVTTPSASLHAVGEGSTSGTTNLLLENDSNVELVKLTDDGTMSITGSVSMAFPSASSHQTHQVPGIYKTPGFSYLVDNDFYVDDNIRLHWDTSGNDFAVEILTNPSAGEVHIVYNNEGTYTYFDRQVSDGLLDIDTSFLDDEVGIATLCAPDDNSYPFYRVTLVRSNVTYTNRMYATIEKILN